LLHFEYNGKNQAFFMRGFGVICTTLHTNWNAMLYMSNEKPPIFLCYTYILQKMCRRQSGKCATAASDRKASL